MREIPRDAPENRHFGNSIFSVGAPREYFYMMGAGGIFGFHHTNSIRLMLGGRYSIWRGNFNRHISVEVNLARGLYY